MLGFGLPLLGLSLLLAGFGVFVRYANQMFPLTSLGLPAAIERCVEPDIAMPCATIGALGSVFAFCALLLS